LDTAGRLARFAATDEDPAVRRALFARAPELWRLPPIVGSAEQLDRRWRRGLAADIGITLASADATLRAAAAWALIDAPTRELDEQLRTLVTATDQPADVRRAAFAALASGPDEDRFAAAKGVALEFLHDADPRARDAARAYARRQRGDDAEFAWLLRAADPDPALRAAAAADAATVLAATRHRDFVHAGLERLARDPVRSVRLAAVDAAGTWQDPAAAALLARLSAAPDPEVAAAAAQAQARRPSAARPAPPPR
jgi:hypothetical protein